MNRRFFFTFLLIFSVVFGVSATEIWIAVNGKDTNPGTKSEPLATLDMALRKARNLRRLNDPGIKDGIHIVVMDGFYQLTAPLFIRPEDSGTAESPTIIEADKNASPTFSGGIAITNWKLAGAVNGLKAGTVWVADVPKIGGELINFRQLWVNDKKAIRAKSTSGTAMGRILSWDKDNETCWIPIKDKTLNYQPGMELFIQQWWAIANLRISDIEVKGDSAKLAFFQPESRIQSEHPWPAPWISKKTGNSPFYLSNAMAFLDEPGEWFVDRTVGKIYYLPRAGEQMNRVSVIAPLLENILEIKGTIDSPVQNITIKGLTFKYANWLRPSLQGHVPLQAGMYLIDAYKLKTPGTPDKSGLENQAWVGRPRAAVEVNYAHNISVEACVFKHLASTGLDLHRGAKHSVVKGNLFKDIGGSGINIGVFSDEAFEAHLPYKPSDEREISTHISITDNLVTDVTNEDWGAVGISAGFVQNIEIAHNEISEVAYTGIGLGWGWTKTINVMRNNVVKGNKIHHYGKHLYDVAGIYTLSAQPNSIIEENVISDIYFNPYAHDPYHWFYLYTDEGSAYFTVKNNWVPSEKFLQNANGPNNIWRNNNAQTAQDILNNAGIRAPYKALENEVVVDKSWPLQEIPHFAALELTGTEIDLEHLGKIAKANGVIEPQFYQRKKQVVLYGKLNHIDQLKSELTQEFPKVEIQAYDNPDKNFKGVAGCSNEVLEAIWQHMFTSKHTGFDDKTKQEYVNDLMHLLEQSSEDTVKAFLIKYQSSGF